ncbi:BolA family protein [Kozakia baliensis]|uniref:ATP-binding protein n=1 Tax=Kozakia baliensis TaxID=153496 RepID=A0A1D8UTA4_9PROT|nr:BolA family transcriptional regulator [Kozakia baliensis]AOX16880.1 ATP-binding protein [Kozakia baliensis]GBR24570.1 BolA-like protein [Kozakia baliensis NRIC 0488]GEL64781.1 ATP-binding protein [Kozakia baliensis]
MPMTAGEIERTIKAALPDANITIEDLAGDGDHYACTVTSEAFHGLTRVRQHKLVYDAFGDRMGTELHAMALKTQTP